MARGDPAESADSWELVVILAAKHYALSDFDVDALCANFCSSRD